MKNKIHEDVTTSKLSSWLVKLILSACVFSCMSMPAYVSVCVCLRYCEGMWASTLCKRQHCYCTHPLYHNIITIITAVISNSIAVYLMRVNTMCFTRSTSIHENLKNSNYINIVITSNGLFLVHHTAHMQAHACACAHAHTHTVTQVHRRHTCNKK